MTKEEIIRLIKSHGFECEFKDNTCNIFGSGNLPSNVLIKVRQYCPVALNTKYMFSQLSKVNKFNE